MYIAVLFQAFLQCTQDIFVYSDVGIVYSGICNDLKNKIIQTGQCTLYRQVYTAILYQASYWLPMRQCTQHIYCVLLYGVLNIFIVYSCMVSVYT